MYLWSSNILGSWFVSLVMNRVAIHNDHPAQVQREGVARDQDQLCTQLFLFSELGQSHPEKLGLVLGASRIHFRFDSFPWCPCSQPSVAHSFTKRERRSDGGDAHTLSFGEYPLIVAHSFLLSATFHFVLFTFDLIYLFSIDRSNHLS